VAATGTKKFLEFSVGADHKKKVKVGKRKKADRLEEYEDIANLLN